MQGAPRFPAICAALRFCAALCKQGPNAEIESAALCRSMAVTTTQARRAGAAIACTFLSTTQRRRLLTVVAGCAANRPARVASGVQAAGTAGQMARRARASRPWSESSDCAGPTCPSELRVSVSLPMLLTAADLHHHLLVISVGHVSEPADSVPELPLETEPPPPPQVDREPPHRPLPTSPPARHPPPPPPGRPPARCNRRALRRAGAGRSAHPEPAVPARCANALLNRACIFAHRRIRFKCRVSSKQRRLRRLTTRTSSPMTGSWSSTSCPGCHISWRISWTSSLAVPREAAAVGLGARRRGCCCGGSDGARLARHSSVRSLFLQNPRIPSKPSAQILVRLSHGIHRTCHHGCMPLTPFPSSAAAPPCHSLTRLLTRRRPFLAVRARPARHELPGVNPAKHGLSSNKILSSNKMALITSC